MNDFDLFSVLLAKSGQYSKSEIDEILSHKADLDSEGFIPTSEIPPEVFERMKVVENDAARFALTTDDVQNGDIVYVNDTQIMYFVYDDTHLDSEAGYKPFAAGVAAKAIGDKNGDDITTTYQKLLTFDGTYDSSTNPAATVSTVTNAVNDLDVTGASNIAGSKTIKAWSETDGKVSVTTQDIAITGSQAVLTGYTKASTKQNVAATDTITVATGKLEQRVETNETNISLIQQTIGDINTVLEEVL